MQTNKELKKKKKKKGIKKEKTNKQSTHHMFNEARQPPIFQFIIDVAKN
jgi:hypothetical protein